MGIDKGQREEEQEEEGVGGVGGWHVGAWGESRSTKTKAAIHEATERGAQGRIAGRTRAATGPRGNRWAVEIPFVSVGMPGRKSAIS